ncbi:MAG: helix-turn-helix domain-containing protein [Kiritimatiellia bacterium]
MEFLVEREREQVEAINVAIGEQLRKARIARGLTPSQVAVATRMKVQTVAAIEDEDFGRIAAPIYAKGFIKLYARCVGLDPGPLIEEYAARFATDKNPLMPACPPRDSSGPVAAKKNARPSSTGAAASEDRDLFASRSSGERKMTIGAEEIGSKSANGRLVAGPGSALARFWTACRTSGMLIGTRVAFFWRKLARVVGRWYQVEAPQPGVGETAKVAYEKALARKGVALAAAVLILLVCLTSIFSRCVRWPVRSVRADSSLPEEVRIAVEVPQPYFE